MCSDCSDTVSCSPTIFKTGDRVKAFIWSVPNCHYKEYIGTVIDYIDSEGHFLKVKLDNHKYIESFPSHQLQKIINGFDKLRYSTTLAKK